MNKILNRHVLSLVNASGMIFILFFQFPLEEAEVVLRVSVRADVGNFAADEPGGACPINFPEHQIWKKNNNFGSFRSEVKSMLKCCLLNDYIFLVFSNFAFFFLYIHPRKSYWKFELVLQYVNSINFRTQAVPCSFGNCACKQILMCTGYKWKKSKHLN